MRTRGKAAQAWGFDLAAGLMIFVSGVIFFYFYAVNNSSGDEQKILFMQEEAKLIAGNLLVEGTPSDWNETNVIRIGFYDSGRINQTKLERFYELAESDYSRTKLLFNVKDEYYVHFPSGTEVQGDTIYFMGNNESQNAKNLFKVTRAIVYKNKIIGMEVVAWN